MTDLPFAVVKAQMMAESSGNPRAKSPCGAMGLLQLMPLTAKEVGCEDPYNPDDNIKGATLYLAKQKANICLSLGQATVTPDDVLRLSLASYNGGFGYTREAIRKALREHTIPSWEYVRKALQTISFKGLRPDWKQIVNYVEKILPSA
jgi:soluble lytic murein transglycosylase-like protein